MSPEASEPAVDYSLIVPAYNEADQLPRTLPKITEAMQGVATFRGELIVTDNNSTDNTAEIARELGARVVFEPVNHIARSRNAGAREARGRYLVFVDADTTIGPDLLGAALDALTTGQVCGGGSRVATSDPVPSSVRITLGVWNSLAGVVRWAAGSFVYCLKEAWEDTGGFDERFYASEEIHFSRALKRWGRRRRMRFVVLQQSVDTSMRKFHWYTAPELIRQVARFVFCPWRLRSREHCELWYERPPADTEQNSEGSTP